MIEADGVTVTEGVALETVTLAEVAVALLNVAALLGSGV
jgi:hypothetical protein